MCEFCVPQGIEENIPATSYYDNIGMTNIEVKKYSNFMNTSQNLDREKDCIGKHGMGSKFYDYEHSKKGRTVVFTNYDNNYNIIDFDYKNMAECIKDRKNMSFILTNNTSIYNFELLDDMINKIDDIYDKAFICVYSKQTLKNIVEEKLSKMTCFI